MTKAEWQHSSLHLVAVKEIQTGRAIIHYISYLYPLRHLGGIKICNYNIYRDACV
jgi:hypothetical protein